MIMQALNAPNRRPCSHNGAAFSRILRIQDNQTGIIDPAIGVFKCMTETGPQRRPGRICAQIQDFGTGQQLSAANMIVKKQTKAEQPGRSQALRVRQHEPQRPDDVRRHRP